jgi:hypothetical protein
MPDDLYDRDILIWSEQQAHLLRRLAAGERVNEAVDWPNLIEEVEDVGRSQLSACESFLVQAIVHMMKIRIEPGGPVTHWTDEVDRYLDEALSRLSPAMRGRVDLERVTFSLPSKCPYLVDELLAEEPDIDALLAKLG